jgi:exonuclease SbcC
VQAAAVDVARTGAALESAAQARESAAAREADLAAKAQLARTLASELTRWNELDRAFGDLRTDLNQQMRPDLRERSSGFLQALTRGRYDDVELDEEYQVTVVEDGELKPVISGGEEDVLHLSLRLAISEMIADRAGQPLSMLILDEVFGSLDEERRLAVVELLRALADRFPQVLLISHIEGLRDAFDRVIRVTYDHERGVSTVAEDRPELVDVAE